MSKSTCAEESKQLSSAFIPKQALPPEPPPHRATGCEAWIPPQNSSARSKEVQARQQQRLAKSERPAPTLLRCMAGSASNSSGGRCCPTDSACAKPSHSSNSCPWTHLFRLCAQSIHVPGSCPTKPTVCALCAPVLQEQVWWPPGPCTVAASGPDSSHVEPSAAAGTGKRRRGGGGCGGGVKAGG